jgi:hypothetical protein
MEIKSSAYFSKRQVQLTLEDRDIDEANSLITYITAILFGQCPTSAE